MPCRIHYMHINIFRITGLMTLLGLLTYQQHVGAQTSQPAQRKMMRTHADFLKLAEEYPLAQRFLLSTEGKPLTEEQNLKILKADQLLTGAESFRMSGDYASARDRAEEAMQICRNVLGPAHYLSISATGARRLYGACADQVEDRQAVLKQADKF